MSMRIFSAGFLIPISALLAGCGAQPDDPAGVADDSRIECAIAGAEWSRACAVERIQDAEGLILTVRHPDGGFRRLLVTTDGRGVIPADGAETATFKVIGADRIEVTVAGDKYRLPATIKGRAGA